MAHNINMRHGVYQIRNLKNGRCYIGSAAGHGFGDRWNLHRRQLENKIHHSKYLQRAWNKYGADAFIFEILLYCDPENCLMYEQIAIDYFKPKYNMSPTAGSPFGFKHTKGSRRKMSQAAKLRLKDSTNHPMYNKQHTEQAKEKMRKAKLGKEKSPEAIAKIKGKTHSLETKEKIRKAVSGSNHPMWGKKHSEESKRKMSESRKKYLARKENDNGK